MPNRVQGGRRWIGVFWRNTPVVLDSGPRDAILDIWVCIVPCVPLHLTFFRNIAVPSADEEARKGD
jgi:hypothetical protein